jgi:hypothetical protein
MAPRPLVISRRICRRSRHGVPRIPRRTPNTCSKGGCQDFFHPLQAPCATVCRRGARRRWSAWRDTEASEGVRSCPPRERRRLPGHAQARTAAGGAVPWSRCGGEERGAQQAGGVDAAAHAPHVCRRTGGHGRRPWPQDGVPRRAVTGAMPASVWRASAEGTRSRGAPQAPRRRGAHTAPAPGTASPTGPAGGSCARWALAVSTSARAGTATRSWAPRAGPRSTWGARTPSAVVRARALVRAARRVALRAVARPWWARKTPSTVVRRARGAAVRGGQRRRTSPTIAGACSGNPCRTGGTSCVRARVTRWVRRTVAPTRRRRSAPSGAQARLGGLVGLRGVRVSRGVRRRWRPGVRPRWGPRWPGAGSTRRGPGPRCAAGQARARGTPRCAARTRGALACVPGPQRRGVRGLACGGSGPQACIAAGRGASGVEAAIVVRLSPVAATQGRPDVGDVWRHGCARRVWSRWAKGPAGGRAAQACESAGGAADAASALTHARAPADAKRGAQASWASACLCVIRRGMFLRSLTAPCQVCTVSLKAGLYTYKGFAAALQRPLRASRA